MKTTRLLAKLAFLCLMTTGMGFPDVVSDAENGKARSVRYVKVGFLACTRQVGQAKPAPAQAKCADKPQNGKCEPEPEASISSQLGGSVQIIAAKIRRQLEN